MKTLFRIIMSSLCIFALLACSDDPVSHEKAEDRENLGQQVLIAGSPRDSLVLGTVNMTVGWNAEDLILNNLKDTQTVYTALQSLYNQFIASKPSQRMRSIAATMIAHPVDVMALQEVQVMRAGDTSSFHFVDSLLVALREQGDLTAWQIVAQSPMNQITLDVSTSTGARMDIDFWEGNVFLVKPGIQILDTMSKDFPQQVNFNILGTEVYSTRGFQRIKIQTSGGALWQLYNTHLEVEQLFMYPTMQGQALNQRAWDDWQLLGDATQIVIGDLNSKPGKSGMQALTTEATGLLDLWKLSEDPDTLGYTCCISNLDNPDAWYNRRIDYVLARNFLEAPSVERIPLITNGTWGGDHAMLRAKVLTQILAP